MSPILLETAYTRIASCRHGPMVFLKHDRFIGRSLEVYGEWCEREVGLLLQLVQPGDVVVDVGANVGSHAVPLAKRVGHSGRVIAIEPQAALHRLLGANLALADAVTVDCLWAAAGATAGRTFIPELDPGASQNFGGIAAFGHLGDGSPEGGREVPVVTLDSLGLTRCALIKIDVEGFEAEVLSGATTLIRRTRPILFLENNRPELSPRLNRMVLEAGYRCWWFFCSYFNPENFRGQQTNIFAGLPPEANLLCIPAEFTVNGSGLEPLAGPDDTWPAALARLRPA